MDLIEIIYGYFRPGGILMIPIILVSVFIWILIIERVYHFMKLEQDDIDPSLVMEIFKDNKMSGLPEKGLRFRVIKNFLERRTGDKRLDQSILNLCAMVERSYLKRYLSFIGILASIAPLLGLLGTVTGMITTFNVISCSGTGNAKAMAEGISKALITTQGGLMVAVPGLYMGNFLNNHARRLENRLDELIMTIKRHMSDD